MIELIFGQILPLDILCCNPTMDILELHSLLRHRALVQLKLCSKDFYDWFMQLETRDSKKLKRTNLMKIDSYFRHYQSDMISNLITIVADNSPRVVCNILSGFVYGASKSDFVGLMNGRLLPELFQFRYLLTGRHLPYSLPFNFDHPLPVFVSRSRLGMTFKEWDAINWQGPFMDALEFFRIKSGILIQIMKEGMQLLIKDQVANRFTEFVKAIIGIADKDKVWHTMTEITINEVLLCGTCFFQGVEAPVGSGFEPFKSLESKQI